MVENILDVIIENKREEVQRAKALVPVEELKSSEYYSRTGLSLKEALSAESASGIIAEFKRKSPSKGIFLAEARPEIITRAYAENGASALSVLTDESFFAGNMEDLKIARTNQVPILRKDFIIDAYQVTESKSIGADLILLIAACLEPAQVEELAGFAKSLGLEVLLEIHNDSELDHICGDIDLVGVNNRDLKTFTVDIARSTDLAEKIPSGKIKISESGISDVQTIMLLKRHGYKGFLIGETFMKAQDPAIAFARFVHELKNGTT